MKISKLMSIAVVILASGTYCRPQCNCETGGKYSDLTIVPIDRSKNLSDRDVYYVKEFVDLRSNINRAGLFGNGKGHHSEDPYYAAHVPYGRYRINLQSKSGSESFGRLIDVCQPDESIEVPREFARVHIVSLFTNVNSVKNDPSNYVKVKKFQNDLDDTEMSDLFQKGIADKIPYGYYHLEVILPLGYVKREVDVFQPDVWIFSDSQGFYGDVDISGPRNIVRGKIINIPTNERPVFMTMSGIYIPYTVNSVVSDAGNGNGSFSFVASNPMGAFMLYTIGKSGVLDAREFQLPRESDIVIDLSRPSPPKIDDRP